MEKKYNEIFIGSNVFKNSKFLFQFNGMVPLICEKGKYPLIWINAINLKEERQIEVVKESESLLPAINVYKTSNDILINYNSEVILETSNIISKKNTLVIKKLDLRPLGLNLYLDNDILFIGGIKLESNTFDEGGLSLSVNKQEK